VRMCFFWLHSLARVFILRETQNFHYPAIAPLVLLGGGFYYFKRIFFNQFLFMFSFAARPSKATRHMFHLWMARSLE